MGARKLPSEVLLPAGRGRLLWKVPAVCPESVSVSVVESAQSCLEQISRGLLSARAFSCHAWDGRVDDRCINPVYRTLDDRVSYAFLCRNSPVSNIHLLSLRTAVHGRARPCEVDKFRGILKSVVVCGIVVCGIVVYGRGYPEEYCQPK